MAIRDWQGRNDFLMSPRPGGGTLYGGPPAPPPPPSTAPVVDPNDNVWAQYQSMQDAIKNGSSGGGGGSQSDGGIGSAIKGGLGTVLGGAVKKLDWVANLGLLGAEELSEFISGEEFSTQKNADGTLNEFGQQSNWDKLNDPEYGFGKLMGDVTDNKWINRTVGLVGDLAFDPITYVGGAAMKSPMVMGKLGREALVKKAATMGMSDDVVKHVGKFGHVGLDDATRKALDVKKAGVYWGVGDASIRLPGTKTIGTATEKAFSSVRRNTAGRLVGKVGKGRGDAALAPYRRAAQTGETVIHEGRRITPKLAGLTLESVEQFTGFAGKAAEPWARSAQRVFQGQDQEVSKRVTKEINNLNVGWKYGDVVDPAKLAALSPEAQRTQALMREIYESTLEATKDPVTGEYAINMGFRGPGYLPNRQTKEAWDFFGDDVSRASFNGGTLDAGQSAAKTRVFLPGKTVDIKGRPVTFGDATIDDINQKLTEAFPEAGITKWMEDNSVVLVERYIGEMSRIQGHHAMLMRLREVGELGNEAHYTTEMIEGMANLSKNRDVARLLKGEVKERNLQMAQMRGEAARLGQLVSKDLDEALVRLADEAATEHATLRGFVKNIKNEIQQDAGDRSKNLKNIRAGFTAERNRLETVFNEAVAAKTEIDESIAAIKQSIEEGFIKETADVRGELDKLIRKQNAIAEKMKLDSDALEGVTEMDEMYGFVMSQAGRLDEMADSPEDIMQLYADLQGVGLIQNRSPLYEEVVVGRYELDQADEIQRQLELLDEAGTFDGTWEDSLNALKSLENLNDNPFLNQARVEIVLANTQKLKKTLDGKIKREAKRLNNLKTKGWEPTGNYPIGAKKNPAYAEAVKARNELIRRLGLHERNHAWRKDALGQARKMQASKNQLDEIVGQIEEAEGAIAKAVAGKATVKPLREQLEVLIAARDRFMVQYLELEDEIFDSVLQASKGQGKPSMNMDALDVYIEGRPGQGGGGLLSELETLFKKMIDARKSIDEADAAVARSQISPAMKKVNASLAPGGKMHQMRRDRGRHMTTIEELNAWTKPAGYDSKAIVDQGVLGGAAKRSRQESREIAAQEAQPPDTLWSGMYDAQRPKPVYPETYRAGSMNNARVLDRREMVQSMQLLRDIARKKGTYERVARYLDDAGRPLDSVDGGGIRYTTTTERVPNLKNPKLVSKTQDFRDDLVREAEEYNLPAEVVESYRTKGVSGLDVDGRAALDNQQKTGLKIVESLRRTQDTTVLKGKTGLVSQAKKDLEELNQLLEDLVDIPRVMTSEVGNAEVNVVRVLLDGLNDGVTSARKQVQHANHVRRSKFPQTYTPSHDDWVKGGKIGRPVNAPTVKGKAHPDFQGGYETWPKELQDEFDRVNELSKIAHSGGNWPDLATKNAWEDLGKLPDGKYDPEGPWNLTWKQTKPYKTQESFELRNDQMAGNGIFASTSEEFADSESLTQSVESLVGFKGNAEDGISLQSSGSVDDVVDDVYGGMAPDGSDVRGAAEDIAEEAREAKDAYRAAMKSRDAVLKGFGISEDLINASRGQGMTNNRDILKYSVLSHDGKVAWLADGIVTTPRRMAQMVSDVFDGDFAAYKAMHPDTKAKDFFPPFGKNQGGLSYKESGDALGFQTRKFTYSEDPRSQFMRHTVPGDQKEYGQILTRDILEGMGDESREKLYQYARQEAGQVRRTAMTDRRIAQAHLADVEGQLKGQTLLRNRLKDNSRRTWKAHGEFEDAVKKISADAEAGRAPLVDDLERMEKASATLNEDINKFAAVENALGKREAEQVANIDAVAASLGDDLTVFTEHADWAKGRLKSLKALQDRTKTLDGYKWGENTKQSSLVKRREEFKHILHLADAEAPNDKTFKTAARLFDNYENQLTKIKDFDDTTQKIEALYQTALAGAKGGDGFSLDMQRAMVNGFEKLDSTLFPGMADDSINSQLKSSLENWMGAMRDDMDLKWYDEATQIFKSYATMTPGFHLRNYMGATFMNFSDGVTVNDTRLGMKHWRAYVADPDNYIGTQSEDVQNAFAAVFAVGAGGSFDPGELGTGAGKAWKALRSNKATRMSRRYGEDLVEGPVRLAAALNTTRRGGGMSTAASRVKRLHFDYSDLSSLDQKMKRVIPFYMFMSRNLPLQIEQMWRKPKAYAIYNHFMNNFDESEENTLMPKYLKDAGAIVMGGSWFGDESKDFVFAPDLQHNNLMQDIMAFSGEGEGGWPILDGLLASGNPIVTKPIEIATNHSGFRGGDAFFNKKRGQYGGWEDKSGQEQALERIMYGLEGVFTPTGTAKGLLGIDPLGSEDSKARVDDRQLQKVLNFLGFPAKQLGDYERDYERRRQGREG